MNENKVITVNDSGVYSNDARGNKYYRGYPQTNLNMARFYFAQAKNFWAHQTLNGRPLVLREVQLQTAANSSVPYNMSYQKRAAPTEAPGIKVNRVAWYNVKFDCGETGWICNRLYLSVADACTNLAVDTLYQLYMDKKVVSCIRDVMENTRI